MIDAFNVLSVKNESGLDGVRTALVTAPAPLIARETIQIVLVREVQDYTILRTEETRELNTVWTPRAMAGDPGESERVAFLASKQKGAESRELEALLRTWNAAAGRNADECYLKSKLCMECPRCVLFGATDVGKGSDKGANIKHRIAYATAFSLLPVDPALRETHTFNGVDGATQRTGQTLGSRESVRPGALFASIVTLRSITEIELVIALKTILSCTRYGAETRIGGIVRNHVLGIVAAHEEILSPLELTLELAGNDALPSATQVNGVLNSYRAKCATPGSAHVLAETEVAMLLDAVQKVDLTKQRLDQAYGAASAFRKHQTQYSKKSKE
jgi:CRISPR type I-D-associated protein Csc2